jgi:hypothetical protein
VNPLKAMPKSIKRPKAFQIPTIEEVEKFINQAKPDWPLSFVQRTAKKFVLRYQATGWQYGGRLVKDWHAVFWLNWSEPKYPEDIKALDDALKSWTHKCLQDEKMRKSAGLFAVVEGAGPSPFDRYLESMDEIFKAWQVGNASDSQLRAAAESLRKNNFLLLPKSQIEQIKADQGNNADLGKLLAIRQFFNNLKAKGQTVTQYIRSRTSVESKTNTA